MHICVPVSSTVERLLMGREKVLGVNSLCFYFQAPRQVKHCIPKWME